MGRRKRRKKAAKQPPATHAKQPQARDAPPESPAVQAPGIPRRKGLLIAVAALLVVFNGLMLWMTLQR